MRGRLSVMMFLEYFIWGAWYVTLGTWLGQRLHFCGQEIGLPAGRTALGALLSPFLVGLMSDELFANQRLLASLHGIRDALLWFASPRSTFGAILFVLLFYYTFTNPFLNEIGVQNAAGKMTMGQMSELLFMVTLPWFFRRLGVKYTLMLGMFAWVLRYVCFGMGNSSSLVWLLYLGIVMHVICYDFFFVTGQVYVDPQAPVALRAAAQGLITFITYGIGMFIGSWICGRVVDFYAKASAAGGILHDWRSIWMVPAIASAIVFLFFWAGFRNKE